jgi:outer membrane lipoprotein-sorting protein
MRLLFALAVSFIPTVAQADAAGDQAVATMDAALSRARTQYTELEVRTREQGRPEKTMGMNVREKGSKRLTEFTSPADMKGTKVLVVSSTETYVFLPAFGKVRRIASHSTDQSTFGMAFSQDDLATNNYGAKYTAQLTGQNATEIKLVLTPKAGQTTGYAKIEVTVAKDRMLPTELRYFNASNALVKTETRRNYSCEGNVCSPGERTMTAGGTSTTLVRKKWKVNENISDDVFSKRSLGE